MKEKEKEKGEKDQEENGKKKRGREEKKEEKGRKRWEHIKNILAPNVKSIEESFTWFLEISMQSYLLDVTEKSLYCSMLSSQSLQISKESSILGSVISRTPALKITLSGLESP